MTLTAPPEALLADEAVTLQGQLSCPLAEQADGQQVEIEQHTARTRGMAVAGTALAQADGSFAFTLAAGLSAKSTFRAIVPAVRARSARVVAKVLPAVSLSGPAAGTELPGAQHRDASTSARTVVFSGTVSPAAAGARIVLERAMGSDAEAWRRIGVTETGPEGRYAISHTFVVAGPATVRVVVRAHGLPAAASETISYEVAPRQNPRLTITPSVSMLGYGRPLSIAGVAAAGEGTALTLLARTRGGAPEAVASASAGAGGRYAFPPETPTQDTTYFVRGGGTRSAPLRAGVQPLLSAQGPAEPVQQGQALRVCGTVEPATPGQIVLLQRRDGDGLGFHTVATTTLGSSSDYCLEHTPFAEGSESYRVRVPRSDDMRAAASALLQVDVTAAAAAEAPAPEAEAAPPAPVEGTPPEVFRAPDLR